MKIHLVGGFLGSGKTTAIIAASKVLMARGLRVGVVTNDQGRYLVDTAFLRLSNLPAVEVTGGCFCCNYDDLNNRMEELIASADPDVIFAESVGSCADIVATVVKPLLSLGGERLAPASFSVFADARLLLRRLQGAEMPFSEDVVYIFDKQIEEAGLLVINKADLLSTQQLNVLEGLVQTCFPCKAYRFQSSLSADGVWAWVNALQSGQVSVPVQSLQMDYARYAAGEAKMAWVDQAITLQVSGQTGKAAVVNGIRRLTQRFAAQGVEIGHLKFILTGMLNGQGSESKISIPSLDEADGQARIPELEAGQVQILVNARVEMAVDDLRTEIMDAFRQEGVSLTFGDGDAFAPQPPKPTHRL